MSASSDLLGAVEAASGDVLEESEFSLRKLRDRSGYASAKWELIAPDRQGVIMWAFPRETLLAELQKQSTQKTIWMVDEHGSSRRWMAAVKHAGYDRLVCDTRAELRGALISVWEDSRATT